MIATPKASELRSKWTLFVYNKQLGLAWVVAALFGVFVISMSQQLDAKRFFLPVLIMLVYSIVAFNRGHEIFKSVGSSDSYQNTLISQLADSVYFLGFLWTLWALIDSFVLKSNTAAASIFRTFGYALVTTSCGMFLRLAILQFRYTAIDQGSEAEVSIEEKLQRFGASVHAAESALLRWRQVMAESSSNIATFDQELRKTVNTINEEVRGSMLLLTSQHKEMVTVTTDSSRAGIEELVQSAKAELLSLTSDLATPLRTEMEQLADTLKRSNAALAKTFPKLVDGTAAWVTQIQQTETSLSGLRGAARVTEESMAALQVSMGNVVGTLQKIDAAEKSLNNTLEEAFKGIGQAASESIKDGLRNADWSGAVRVSIEDQRVLEGIRRVADGLQATDKALSAGLERCVSEIKRLPAAEGLHAGSHETIEIQRQELIPTLHQMLDHLVQLKEAGDGHKKHWWPF
jgi:hypothetical protein